MFRGALSTTAVDLQPFAPKFSVNAPVGRWTPPTTVDTSNLFVQGNDLTTCPGQMMIGCVQIRYVAAKPDAVSVIADVSSSRTLSPTVTPASWGCSKDTFYGFKEGAVSKEQMLGGHKDGNNMTVWLLRLVGILGAWIAAYCFFSPITWCAGKVGDCFEFIPCVGDFMSGAIEGIADAIVCMMSMGCACSCAFFVIAIVWLYMRPLYGVAFLTVTCCCCGLVAYGANQVAQRSKKKHSESE